MINTIYKNKIILSLYMSKLFEIETDQIVPIRIIVELLKEVIEESNIEIIRDDEMAKSEVQDMTETATAKDNKEANAGGIRIIAIDAQQQLIIIVKLTSKSFDVFDCKKKKTDLGVNMSQLYKIIKMFDKGERLKLYINSDDKSNLVLDIDNVLKNNNSIYKLKLCDVNKRQLNIPQTNYDVKICIETNEFHKICREMNQLADNIEITCTKNSISFKCKGDSIEGSKTCYASQNEETNSQIRIQFAEGAPPIVQGIFELKYLVMFTKCSSLCENMLICMKNNYPVYIKYTAATLGYVAYCLSPHADTVLDREFSDDDEYYEEKPVVYKE